PSVYCPDFYSLIPRPPMSTLFSYTTLFRSDNFFAVETYATICFKSVSVSKTNNGYSTTGELSIHGVTKTVTIPFTFKNNTFIGRSEEHTSELQSRENIVCRLQLEKKNIQRP